MGDAVGQEVVRVSICVIHSRLCLGFASFLNILIWKINRLAC